jgi:lipid-A-disaccharide synthase-like uncharacterized protein
MDHATLKTRHRAEREGLHPNLNLRVHRALSWLGRAEQLMDDPDLRYVLLWIAFNAAYATDVDERFRTSEADTFRAFVEKLVLLDQHGRIANLVWSEFPGSIRLLLRNRYVFQDFWSWRNGRIDEAEWQRRFFEAQKIANGALARQDTVAVLGVALNRLYTLRNQLVHGGATWHSSVNRDQVRDGVNLLGQLVPLVIELMLDHPDTLWGDALYPVVEA